MPKVYILQGVPGAGKSTWIRENMLSRVPRSQPVVVSADHYFMRGGEYRFDPTKLGAAHESCMRAFIGAITAARGDVVVDNTNITALEMAPYYLAGRAMGFDVVLVRFDVDAKVAAERNVHGVPLAAIERMKAAMAEPPPFWTVTRMRAAG
jgi:predicted ABC-type ATPase